MSDPQRFSLLRSFSLADWVTLGNAAAGSASVFASIAHLQYQQQQQQQQQDKLSHDTSRLTAALLFLPIALFFDIADGSVARWRHAASALGQELDSLSDLISFGVAPTVFSYALGLDSTLDTLVYIGFICCVVSRLARFNVTTTAAVALYARTVANDNNDDDNSSNNAKTKKKQFKLKYYEGLPSPTSLVVVLVLAACWKLDALPGPVIRFGDAELHVLCVLWALWGAGMVSKRLRVPKP